MFTRYRLFLLVAIAASGLGSVAVADSGHLSKEAIDSAARVDTLTVPSAGEVFAAINKQAKPNWQALYRPPIATAYSSRPQIALNIGGLIADGYIAIEATDSQQVKNVGNDIIALAKTLAVGSEILSRGSSIKDFAENNQWATLKEELEATQNQVKKDMENHGDTALVTLVTLGGWIRGTEVMSSYIASNYSQELAKLLRQPALVRYLRSKLDALPPKQKEDPLVRSVNKHLEEIEKLVAFPRDTAPTLDDVKRLHDIVGDLQKEISKPDTQ